MINEQLDIYFVEGNKMNGYKWEYATRIGVIFPPNQDYGYNEPSLLLNFQPTKAGIMAICRKGEKPNSQSTQQGGYQNNYNKNNYRQNNQNQGGGYQNQGGAPQQNTPAPKSENDYGQFDGNYQRPR